MTPQEAGSCSLHRDIRRHGRVTDPFDFPVEFFHEMEHAERLIQRYDLPPRRPDRPPRPLQYLHPDMPAAYAHNKSLGFGCSVAIEGDEHELYAAWMCRKQTVHDVAFTVVPGLACTTSASPRASNAFYLYLRDPDGHRVEIYTGDPDHVTYRWNVHDDHRRDFWGNAVIDSWYADRRRRARRIRHPDRRGQTRPAQAQARPGWEPHLSPGLPAQARRWLERGERAGRPLARKGIEPDTRLGRYRRSRFRPGSRTSALVRAARILQVL
ncbi:hypothetical protein [Streptomyces mirabilis]|uniref:hypothetical protein n=1 Tax=Streptomyces mirabilis TaxID=68239 RepID=UPI0036555038